MTTTDENIEAMKKMILDNRQIFIRGCWCDGGISFGSCQAIFMDVLGMKPSAARIVPKLQKFLAKTMRMDIAQDLLTMFNNDPDLLKKIITSDES